MAANFINKQYEVFTDRDGTPLLNGYLYFGEPNLNPETHPVTVYWDIELTIPALQPIRTINGYAAQNGSPGKLYSDGDFSMLVKDHNEVLVWSSPTANIPTTTTGGGGGGAVVSGIDYYVPSTLQEILTTVYPKPEAHVLAYIPMTGPNGHGSAYDVSLSNNIVTSVGTPVVDNTFPLHGHGAMLFDGVSTLTMADSAVWAFISDFTVDSYFRPSTLSSASVIWSHSTDANNYARLVVNINGSVTFTIVVGGVATVTLTTAASLVQVNQWCHLAVIRYGNVWSLQFNRWVAASATVATTYPNFTGLFTIGGHLTPSARGHMAEFRIQNGAHWRDGAPNINTTAFPDMEYHVFPIQGAQLRGTVWYKNTSKNVQLTDFGAVGDGVTDDTVAFRALRDYCAITQAVMTVDAYFVHNGYPNDLSWVIRRPLQIEGTGRFKSGLIFNTDRRNEGLHDMAGNVHISKVEIRVYIPQSIQNGQGTYGTCYTGGEIYYNPRYDNGILREPPIVIGSTIRNAWLTRRAGSAAGHAVACTSRHHGLIEDDVIIEGASSGSRHANGLLCHWGTIGYDFPLDASGVIISPLVLQKTAGTYTYHPHNVHQKHMIFRQVSRVFQMSASYDISLNYFDWDGVDDLTTSNGAQLFDFVMGDEADRLAHPESKGKVYANVEIGHGTAWNVSGSGTGSPSIMDATGNSTSKLEDDPATGLRLQDQSFVPNLYLHDINIRGIATDLSEGIDIRNFYGMIQLERIKLDILANKDRLFSEGVVTGAVAFEQINGKIVINNCNFKGGRVLFNNVSEFAINDTTIEHSRFGSVLLTLSAPYVTNTFKVGETVTGATSGVIGRFIAQDAASRILVEQTSTDTATFVAETLTGSGGGSVTVTANTAAAISALKVMGENNNCRLATAVAKGAKILSLASAMNFDGQTGNFTIGQVVTGTTSGATGVIVNQVDSGVTGTLYVRVTSGTFIDNEAITDPLGGAAFTNIPAGLVVGFTNDLKVGDRIEVVGGVLIVAVYADSRSSIIQIEPAPIALAQGAVMTVYRKSIGTMTGTTVIGGRFGIEAANSILAMNDCEVTRAGLYGIFADDDAQVTFFSLSFLQLLQSMQLANSVWLFHVER